MSTLDITAKNIVERIEVIYEDLKVNRSTKHGIISSIKMGIYIAQELQPYTTDEKVFILDNVEKNLKFY
jgi:hypothetical protein